MRGEEERRGESNPRAKLSEAQVLEMRARYAFQRPVTLKDLEADYPVRFTQIQRIIRRRQWRHLPSPPETPPAERRWSPVELEYLLRHAGDPPAELAKALARTPNAIDIMRCRLHKQAEAK